MNTDYNVLRSDNGSYVVKCASGAVYSNGVPKGTPVINGISRDRDVAIARKNQKRKLV